MVGSRTRRSSARVAARGGALAVAVALALALPLSLASSFAGCGGGAAADLGASDLATVDLLPPCPFSVDGGGASDDGGGGGDDGGASARRCSVAGAQCGFGAERCVCLLPEARWACSNDGCPSDYASGNNAPCIPPPGSGSSFCVSSAPGVPQCQCTTSDYRWHCTPPAVDGGDDAE